MKIALIEIDSSHDECLYTQIKFIKSEKENHLTLIHDKWLAYNISFFDLIDNTIEFNPENYRWKKWVSAYALYKILKREEFDVVIFNTLNSSVVKKLLLFPFGRNVKLLGIIHNVKKLNSFYFKNFISKKLNAFYILNDALITNINDDIKDVLNILVFYPVYFPAYPNKSINKGKDEIWICIPGQVEFKRRDYNSLFDSIEKYGINANVKFLFLGRVNKEEERNLVYGKIKELKLENNFMIWEDFIDVIQFHNYLLKSDYILPLIHKGHNSFDLYKYQTTGTYNLAISYKKPLLLEKDSFYRDALFWRDAILYEKERLLKTINHLSKIENRHLYGHVKLDFSYQKDNYLKCFK